RDLIDGVDVVDAFGARLIAPGARCRPADSQAGLADWAAAARRCSPAWAWSCHTSDGVRDSAAGGADCTGGPPRCSPAAHTRLAVLLVFALQNAPCGRSAERVVGLVAGGQQFDGGPRVALRKAVPPIAHRFHRALGLIAGNQARHLRPAAPGHLLQVRRSRPRALRPCCTYCCWRNTVSIQAKTCGRFSPRKWISSLAWRNAAIPFRL